jgi:protein O-GlcNAc transferase
MARGWLVLLAVLLGIGFSFAADSKSSLSSDQRWDEARKYLAEGKAKEAKAAFEELLGNYPQEADLHLFLGITLLRLRDPQRAEAAVKQALTLNPDHVEARTLLAWIDSEIHGDFDSAIEEYSKAVKLRPDLAETYNNLGVAQKRKGQLERAAGNFSRALERRPDYSPALSNRGWVFVEQEKWPEARKDFERALAIDPENQGALQGLARVLEQTKDYAGAQKILRQLISRSPNFVYWLEWSRIGLIRYWWVLLSIALAVFLKGRFFKARSESHGR